MIKVASGKEADKAGAEKPPLTEASRRRIEKQIDFWRSSLDGLYDLLAVATHRHYPEVRDCSHIVGGLADLRHALLRYQDEELEGGE